MDLLSGSLHFTYSYSWTNWLLSNKSSSLIDSPVTLRKVYLLLDSLVTLQTVFYSLTNWLLSKIVFLLLLTNQLLSEKVFILFY